MNPLRKKASRKKTGQETSGGAGVASVARFRATNFPRQKSLCVSKTKHAAFSSREVLLQPAVERMPPLRADAGGDALSPLEQQ